jgi:hypothetical protein
MDRGIRISLRAGDLFRYSDRTEGGDWCVAVLRVGKKADEWYLSVPSRHPVAIPDVKHNPFRLTRGGNFVNHHGDVPSWYARAHHHPRGAHRVASQYAPVPRQCRVRHEVACCARTMKTAMEEFKRQPSYVILRDLAHNGEGGTLIERWSLALEVLGIHYATAQQLLGILAYHELESELAMREATGERS